jgi:large subunit ribosomal protein L6
VSRIGKLPITVPSGIKVAIGGDAIHLEGPKGKLSAVIPSGISVKVDGSLVRVERAEEARKARALHGLTRKLIANMAEGVSKGFNRVLEINGVG